jgi:YidC/Oxa1 family membrane protein insertase
MGAYLQYPLIFKDNQNELDLSLQFYIGPKEYTELSKVAGLKRLIDYGTFAFFAYPLLEILRFFHKYVIQNYGIAIILLTLLVRGLFYPLSVKSMRSMKEMQKLQPQIASIKEKYKDDPKKLNEEQMALFKAHKVNPAGGCLPMLVQLPVFIALYAVLGNSIELFHAPFFGWIQDLSTKDPLYIYPVLMGLSMFAQQKIAPSAGMDPAQQKIMLVMPVIFSFMMVKLPSGLTLYIFVSTVLGIVQQMALKDKSTVVPQPA